MTLDQFVSTNNGKFIDVDNYPTDNKFQCWDLVELYAEQVLAVPKNPWAITLNSDGVSLSGDAKNAWLFLSHNPNIQQHFIQIPKGQMQKGDINVYDGHPGFPEGHINIDLGNGQVFEQNADPDHSPAHISTRPTTYLLGSLRLKGSSMETVTAHYIGQVYLACLGRAPSDQEVQANMGSDPIQMMDGVLNSDEGKAWRTQIQTWKNAYSPGSSTPVVLGPGNYKVN